MPSVSNLKINLQADTENTYYASWNFTETVKKPKGGASTSLIKVGDWVTIKSGATYYNGVTVPPVVMSETWKVIQVTNIDRAVLGQNKDGTRNIQSAISTKFLTTGSSSGSLSLTKDGTTTTNNLDHYLVKWWYATKDGVWFVANDNGDEVKEKKALYNAPSNAKKIKVAVQPVSKTYTSNNTQVSYWTGTWSYAEYDIEKNDPPVKPSPPTITVDKYKITATNTGIEDPKTDALQYELYTESPFIRNKLTTPDQIIVRNCRASITWDVRPGSNYYVQCRAINFPYGYNPWQPIEPNNGLIETSSISARKHPPLPDYTPSEWSEPAGPISTVPATPVSIKWIMPLSDTSVQIEWDAIENATRYEIQYTTKLEYFDSSTEVQSHTVKDGSTRAIITGMTTGLRYFFRLRAINDTGESNWSDYSTIAIGSTPSAPTTWSSTTTGIVGDPVNLYWVHNATDDSIQSYAQLELYFNNSETPFEDGYTFSDYIAIDNDVLRYEPLSEEEQKEGKINCCTLKTSSSFYENKTSIKWRIRTAGITNAFGDWSVQREITLNTPPTLDFNITDVEGNYLDTITSFPFYINGLAGPSTQVPIGYHVTIASNEQYETVDNMGNPKIVNVGENVYSKFFDTSDPLSLEITPDKVNLENGMSYTVSCVVSMNSGLTAEASANISINWEVVSYEPDIEIGIDRNNYSAYISPYCIDEEGNNITDVTLALYRREFDGSFTEIASSIETDANEYIIDPHPSLDYARYRIVAKSKTTGVVSYYDPPGQPVGGTAVIIQWDEAWNNFDTNDEAELETAPWSGSMLKLPYNIDVSESNSSDVSLIEYIGRKHPVSYYGTQLGNTATWNLEISKDDKETLYALRRLAIWMGDVYVREPSGSGYWANITVSFSQKHCEVTIPVSLSITRVEGGM